jgi:hypothetical protein
MLVGEMGAKLGEEMGADIGEGMLTKLVDTGDEAS